MQGRGCLARSTISFGCESGRQLTGFGWKTQTIPPSGSLFVETGKKGTGAERSYEPRPAPRNKSSIREGSGLGSLLTSSPILMAAWASKAISSGSGAAVATTPEWGAALPHLHPQRT